MRLDVMRLLFCVLRSMVWASSGYPANHLTQTFSHVPKALAAWDGVLLIG